VTSQAARGKMIFFNPPRGRASNLYATAAAALFSLFSSRNRRVYYSDFFKTKRKKKPVCL
jgi:hypothetical protein